MKLFLMMLIAWYYRETCQYVLEMDEATHYFREKPIHFSVI